MISNEDINIMKEMYLRNTTLEDAYIIEYIYLKTDKDYILCKECLSSIKSEMRRLVKEIEKQLGYSITTYPIFTDKEEEEILRLRDSISKSTAVTLEDIYIKYTNNDFGTGCNCSGKERKIKVNKFYEWYEGIN
jgi:hypothetical protein